MRTDVDPTGLPRLDRLIIGLTNRLLARLSEPGRLRWHWFVVRERHP